MMFTCLGGRKTARKVGKELKYSLLTENWKVVRLTNGLDPDPSLVTIGGLRNGNFLVFIDTKRIRVFDQLRVFYGDIELWFPLVRRCCIRSAVRYQMSLRALADLTTENKLPIEKQV